MFVRVKNLWLSSFLEQRNINDSYVPAVPHCGKRLSAFKLFLFPQPRGCSLGFSPPRGAQEG